MNTAKKNTGPVFTNTDATADKTEEIKKHLQNYFLTDTTQLDLLLNTNFYEKWFTNQHHRYKAI